MRRVRAILQRREMTTLAALVLVVAVFSVLNPIYLSGANLIDVVAQATINGLIAIGMTFAIITGGIDLSVGAVMAVVIVSVGKLLTAGGVPPALGAILGVALGVCLGTINGLMVTKLGLQPFVATLATMSIYRGVAYVMTGGWPVLNVPRSFRRMIDGSIAGVIPTAILILVGFALLGHLILARSRTGLYILAIGGNQEATRLSGVNIARHKIVAYAICGAGAALAGLVMLARLGTGEPTAGTGYELNAIAAAAIGGTSLAGGKGSVVGTLLGALLLAGLKVGLVVEHVDSFWQYIATGGIIAFAAYFEIVRERINARS